MLKLFTKPAPRRTIGDHIQNMAKAKIAGLTDDPTVRDLALDLSSLTKKENGPEDFGEAVKRAEEIVSQGKEFVK